MTKQEYDESEMEPLPFALHFLLRTGLPLMRTVDSEGRTNHSLWIYPDLGDFLVDSGLMEEEINARAEGYTQYQLNEAGKALARRFMATLEKPPKA